MVNLRGTILGSDRNASVNNAGADLPTLERRIQEAEKSFKASKGIGGGSFIFNKKRDLSQAKTAKSSKIGELRRLQGDSETLRLQSIGRTPGQLEPTNTRKTLTGQ